LQTPWHTAEPTKHLSVPFVRKHQLMCVCVRVRERERERERERSNL
jgi:hypothetical protein